MRTLSHEAPLGLWARLAEGFSRLFGFSLADRRRRRRLELLEAEVRAQPHNERALLTLAETHRAGNSIESAIERYWQAAQLYVSSCDHAKALAVMQNALELNPKAFFLRRGAAQTLERLGRNRDAAQNYRQAAQIAEDRGRGGDAQHLRSRADMLDPPRGKRTPTIVRDLVAPPPLPDALPLNPIAEALSRPAGTGKTVDPHHTANERPAPLSPPAQRPEPAVEVKKAPPAPPPSATPWPEILMEPELPPAPHTQPSERNDAPRTQMQIPRSGPEAPSGPAVPILSMSEAERVDLVVAQEMARAFGGSSQPNTTELALDAELYLLSSDPAEAATAQCSPIEVDQIRTRTLVHQAEQELQSLLTGEGPTTEFDMLEPGSFA